MKYEEALDIRWGKLFKKVGFIPIVLPYNYDFKYYDFDGIILSGGNDIGEFEFRDKYELELIDFAINKDIPIFGVCRGMQIISKYFGCEFIKTSNQVGIKHKLQINPKSQYKHYLKRVKRVNSYHNIAIKDITNELIISVGMKIEVS